MTNERLMIREGRADEADMVAIEAWITAGALRAPGAAPAPPQSLASFTSWLQRMAAAGVAITAPDQELVVYLLSANSSRTTNNGIVIETRFVKTRASGEPYTRGRTAHLERLGLGEYGLHSATSLDRDIAGLLLAGGGYWRGPTLAGRSGYHAIAALLESGRCFWQDSSSPPLSAGPSRELELAWLNTGADGALELTSIFSGSTLLLGTAGEHFRFERDSPCHVTWLQVAYNRGESAGAGAATSSHDADVGELPTSFASMTRAVCAWVMWCVSCAFKVPTRHRTIPAQRQRDMSPRRVHT